MAKIGDIVRFLNSVGGGKIVSIEGKLAQVEDEDGFVVPALLKDCVVVAEASSQPKVTNKPSTSDLSSKYEPIKMDEDNEPELPIVETPEGDKLNVVLAYEAHNLKELSTSPIDAVLVNDSNYFLSFTYCTKNEEAEGWTLRKCGVIEPNIVLTLEQLDKERLTEMDRIMVQFVAYKEDKPFLAKPSVRVMQKFDATKFFKLHCFKENPYFDEPVIAIDIVKDDKPNIPERRPDAKALEKAMRQKKAIDRPKTRQLKHKETRNGDKIEVDLHIHELVDTVAGLSNADMLNLQIDEFRRVMDENLKNKGQKIVFIHGKGEGVLRNSLMKELTHRYKGHEVQDASFREYGFGATQVTIR